MLCSAGFIVYNADQDAIKDVISDGNIHAHFL